LLVTAIFVNVPGGCARNVALMNKMRNATVVK